MSEQVQPPEGLRKIMMQAVIDFSETWNGEFGDYPQDMAEAMLTALFDACEVREERRIVIDDENVTGLWVSMPLAGSFASLAAKYASGRVEHRLVIETQPEPVLSDNSTEEPA